MYNETLIRVSKEMRKLLEEERSWYNKRGVSITLVEASRIVAKRARSRNEGGSDSWESNLGLR